MGSYEEYEALLRRSRAFYETALMQAERGYYDLAVFSLEQALQLFLKALLVKLGIGYPRSRSARRLLRLIAEAEPGLAATVEGLIFKYSVELAALEDAYITSRYTPRVFEEAEVERLRRVVEEVFEKLGDTGPRGAAP